MTPARAYTFTSASAYAAWIAQLVIGMSDAKVKTTGNPGRALNLSKKCVW